MEGTEMKCGLNICNALFEVGFDCTFDNHSYNSGMFVLY